MPIKLPWVSHYDHDREIAALSQELSVVKARLAKLELLLATASRRIPSSTTTADLRRPMNTWRTRGSNFTKESTKDPSTFPNTEDSDVSTK